jgi:PAS domain S-box-containing protein
MDIALLLFWYHIELRHQLNRDQMMGDNNGGEVGPEQSACEAGNDCESKFQAIFEHSPLAIMYTDADGTITTCNDNASRLFGAPREKLIGFSYLSIRDESMKSAIAKALSGLKSRFEGEYLTVTGNVLTHMRANFSPAFNPDGSVSGVIGIFEDITERVLIEKDRERLIDELQNALAKVKKLSGFLPICASCKRIRDDQGYWNQIETYISEHSEIDFSHGICPECAKKIYKDLK